MIRRGFTSRVNSGLQKCKLLAGVLLLFFLAACSDSNSNSATASSASTAPFAELVEQGIARYLGQYTPMLSETSGDVVNHFFGTGDGPLCGEGGQYSVATRDQGSDELMIFLEGGGVCWSDVCLYASTAQTGIPAEGILDPERANNPVKGWSQVYLPNCDGSMLVGDQDVDTDGDGQTDRYQRGLHNLSAGLDVAVRAFPAPSRILLAGQSAGGLGTIFALTLVRHVYPDIPIDVLNDSGVGVLKPGAPEFLLRLMEEWNIGAFIPASCADCLASDGHLSDYLIWQMDQDHSLRRGLLSYTQDVNLAGIYLGIGGPEFEQALLEEMQQQEDAHPERTHSWIAVGNGHTFVELEPDRSAGGVVLMDWIGLMLSGSPDWVSVQDDVAL